MSLVDPSITQVAITVMLVTLVVSVTLPILNFVDRLLERRDNAKIKISHQE